MPVRREAHRYRAEGGSSTEDGQRQVDGLTRIVLRSPAGPLPPAFLSFGVGSGLQSASQLGLVPQEETRNLALLFGAVSALRFVIRES